ncbi:hypothetical protein ACKKBF_B31765 [Auxenochlorella protothecoides x Auxenochlorella symbiontica]
MSLLASLPAPVKTYTAPDAPAPTGPSGEDSRRPVKEVPPYGRRQGFVPRRVDDFGGGGAFPEIHVAQYPLEMGRPNQRPGGAGRTDQTVALSVNAEGEVNYDAVVRQGKDAQKWVATTHAALVPKLEQLNSDMPRPDEEEVEAAAKETAAALQAVVSRKQAAVNPKTLPSQPGAPQYIKYTPAQSGGAHNSGAATRIIKMQDMPVDPMEPPKFRHIKVPRGPGSPPVPVMHSPPRALTVQDQADWKIPPCISNWKNSKGYTIPLDKRLAADGRGLQEVQINDQFAKFTEALYIAEQKARASVDARAKMQRELLAREKESKEQELRDLAARARMDRVGGPPGGPAAAGGAAAAAPWAGSGSNTVPLAERGPGRSAAAAPSSPESEAERELPAAHRVRDGPAAEGETRAEREERRQRDEIREERRRERERERRLEARDAHGHKRSKLTRDRDRDISEKIALGQAKVSGGEAMYDQRLFNQDTGVGSGLASEDAYNLYDKPLFADRSEVFRSRGRQDEEVHGAGAGGDDAAGERRFKPDKGFSGVDYGAARDAAAGPVQFEADAAQADVFGLDAFLTDVRGGKRREGPLGDAPRGGSMAAAGGSGGGGGGDGGRRMDFVGASGSKQR